MSDLISIDGLTDAIRSQFQEAPPNGWFLGWDESRCFAKVSEAAASHQTTNHTTFDYGFCNWFEVHIEGDGDRYWTLTIKLSFVAPIYCVHWTQYENPQQGAVIASAPADHRIVEDGVCAAVEAAGFTKISDDWLEHEVSGVELELSGTDRVTIGKCLFSDFAG